MNLLQKGKGEAAVGCLSLPLHNDYHFDSLYILFSGSPLTVNIKAAILGQNAVGDGWFELDLQGRETQIQNGLNYLQELKLQIWDENTNSDW